ncbi:MAG: ribonuclease Z [Gemmatimonadetes bacterium]|nr:ribonuclease Z [Gemmatimonadota bacterium]MBP6670647.1 ribonuclease Z [Gemmatimonadales bacterium]MBK6781500.1 ribonuclease Z [Gemmatimonadota bacterium]MBK7349929.1 ribonuclease Z [Gemmatimonadota bacterium]MBK7715541.1 ribonuclease Z [Gemmatimonadota bacterium]
MLKLTFLGTGAACPTIDRNVSALALAREGETLLFDCGEGTQRQMMRYGVSFTFRDIFFTHWHSDHLLGVIGLLRTLGLLNIFGGAERQDGLTLYGPKGARRVLNHALEVGIERVKFPVEIVELAVGDIIKRPDYDIVTFPTEHRADTIGYALVEHIRLGRFNPELARALGIPEGPLWGKIHKGETITLPDGRRVAPEELVGRPRAGRKVVISGDTRPVPALRDAAKGADLLVHEATFSQEDAARARETGHSTAQEAAAIARDAEVKRLVLTHISPRYSREAPELVAEARAVFPNTQIARDGMEIEVPFESEE